MWYRPQLFARTVACSLNVYLNFEKLYQGRIVYIFLKHVDTIMTKVNRMGVLPVPYHHSHNFPVLIKYEEKGKK